MKWTDVSEPGYKPGRYGSTRYFVRNTEMYSYDEGFVEFLRNFEDYKDLSVTTPVEICVRIWHPPVRLKTIRFFSGEPIVCEVFRNFKSIKRTL